jgi:hypothetical protein
MHPEAVLGEVARLLCVNMGDLLDEAATRVAGGVVAVQAVESFAVHGVHPRKCPET